MTLLRKYPVTLAAAAAALAVSALGWRGRDTPAQLLRISIFRDGDWFWNPQWFGGHLTLGYSTLMPALGALLGITVLGVAITAGAVASFESLVRRRPRATLATAVFAFGMVSNLVVGRIPFGLGAAFALAAIAAHTRGRALAVVLAVCAALSSPVAALFLALAFAAWAYTERQWRAGALLVGASLGPAAVTSVLFGTGGSYPFPITSVAWALTLCAVTALASEDRAVRVACLMYGVVSAATFVVSSPLGSNIVRMPLFLAAPLIVLADPARTRRVLAAVPAVIAFQASQIVEVAAATTIDPSTRPAYYSGMLEYLRAQPGPVRVEIPLTKQHWETAYVAEEIPIARGWERQIDRGVNPEFYDPNRPLDARTYHRWLTRTGVTHVARPDALLDVSSLTEGELIAGGLPYLTPVFHDPHWTVYAVAGTPGLLEGPGVVRELADDRVVVEATAGGRFIVRVRATPHWHVASGDACISATPDGWLVLVVGDPGRVVLEARLDVLDALGGRDTPECAGGPQPGG